MNVGVIILAYLLGSIPCGYLIVRLAQGRDVRESGSGATGATNVMRNAGRAAGVVTLALDALKGFAAVIIARWLTGTTGTTWLIAMVAFVAIVGHVFPIWLGFKAGKGVATGLGVFLAIAPLAVLTSVFAFIAAVVITRYVSLGSILGASSIPIWAWLWGRGNPDLPQILVTLTTSALLIIAKHHENIYRLITGTESKLGAAKS